MSNYVSGPQCIEGLALDSDEAINAFAERRAAEYRGRMAYVDRLVAFCVLIRESAWRAAGRFDEGYGLGNFEDDDYCRRVQDAGYGLVIAEDAFVFHFGHRTFAGLGIEGKAWDELLAENAARFSDKWGGAPGSEPAATGLAERAAAALERGAPEEALRHVAQAVRRSPQDPEAHNALGAVLWSMGAQEKAYHAFQRAAALGGGETVRANLRDAARALNRNEDDAGV